MSSKLIRYHQLLCHLMRICTNIIRLALRPLKHHAQVILHTSTGTNNAHYKKTKSNVYLHLKAFRDHSVVPDLIDVTPFEKLEVTFPSSNVKVDLGNKLAPRDIRDKPEVHYDGYPDSYYTLVLTSPDAPRRKNPIQKEWQQWLVVNIPGSRIEKGETLTEYIPATPVRFTDVHRFVFLVYEQPGRLNFDEPFQNTTRVATRMNFSIKRFADKYDLGNPFAGNFFQAEYDDSVDATLRKIMFPRN